MYLFREGIPREDIGGGILMQQLGPGQRLNVLHWDMADGSVIPLHDHPEEQFGYVIHGGFRMTIAGEDAELKAGDAYYIPPGAPHTFVAVGDTEAIDVFSPVRFDIPGRKKYGPSETNEAQGGPQDE